MSSWFDSYTVSAIAGVCIHLKRCPRCCLPVTGVPGYISDAEIKYVRSQLGSIRLSRGHLYCGGLSLPQNNSAFTQTPTTHTSVSARGK